jgi:hypothetical protein
MADDDTREIGLVSCVKTKRDEPAVPKELYTSDYFRKMRSYAEQAHDEWWILSAKHGLVDPDGEPIEPYEKTLTSAGVTEQREWAVEVFDQMQTEGLLRPPVKFVIHAGNDYYGELAPKLEDIEGIDVKIPTEGLQIGDTLSWYKARL